jgi:hypothetical protein
MRALRSVRQFERVTSGPGSYAATAYWLRAPDRARYRTSGNADTIIIGRHEWLLAPGLPWQRSEYGSGLPFSTRSWFRWTTYGRSVRLLDVRRVDQRRFVDLALMDEGTPVWFQLRVDLATQRVVRERMISEGHFATSRYFGFNQPFAITAPGGTR